ncbi:MAG: hypothetical protein ACRDA0_09945 [Cetobacterium sp.]|uniref:hypothetical protein n=1 Tax=Cetobacterium sp. TaxID=2071632 RepID=UPI003F2ABCFB
MKIKIKKITRERLYKREYDNDISYQNNSFNEDFVNNLAKVLSIMIKDERRII